MFKVVNDCYFRIVIKYNNDDFTILSQQIVSTR